MSRDEDEEAGQRLLRRDAELLRLLDRVDRVGAGVRHADHLRARRLRLEQVAREVRAALRVARRAEHLAAGLGDDLRRVRLERLAEHVVGGDEEPGVAAVLHDLAAGAVREGPVVVRVVHVVRRALLAGDRGGGGTGEERDPLLLGGHRHHGERGAAVDEVHDRVDLVLVEPLARGVRGDVALVLVVRGDDLDGLAEHLPAEVRDRHLHGEDGPRPGEVGVEAGHVGEDADLHDAVGDLVLRDRARGEQDGERDDEEASQAEHAGSFLLRVQTPRKRFRDSIRASRSPRPSASTMRPRSMRKWRSASGATNRKFCSTRMMV